MPRRDGMDTNQEMLADFNSKSHEVFVSAFEREFEGAIPDALIGKPLSALSFRAVRQVARGPEDALRKQELKVRPLSEDDAGFMREHLTMKHYPEDVHDHFGAIATRMSNTAVDAAFDIRSAFPTEGTYADYTAQQAYTTRTRHVDTLTEKPTKFSLALGKTFADEIQDYVNGPLFHLPKKFSPFASTKHYFDVSMTPGLPLNGHEATPWLNEFANTMLQKVHTRSERVERLKALNAPEVILDHSVKIRDEAAETLGRIEEILKNK